MRAARAARVALDFLHRQGRVPVDGRHRSRPVYAGSTDGNLYAVDLAGGKRRWALADRSGFTASAAVRDGLVYVGDSEGRFYCVDAQSGKVKWTLSTGAEIDSSANFYRDCVLVGSQDTNLYCFQAETGKLVWKFDTKDQVWSFPSVLGDRAYFGSCDRQFHVVDLRQGKCLAQVDMDAETACAAALMGETAYVGTEEGRFLAVAPGRPGVLWHYEDTADPAAFRSSAAVTPQAVIVGSRDKLVRAFDPKTGRPLWSFTTKGQVDSSPVVAGNRVFVGSSDGRLYGLDLKSGHEVWQFNAGAAIVASPAVAAGRLVIGSEDGNLYCFGEKSRVGRAQRAPPLAVRPFPGGARCDPTHPTTMERNEQSKGTMPPVTIVISEDLPAGGPEREAARTLAAPGTPRCLSCRRWATWRPTGRPSRGCARRRAT